MALGPSKEMRNIDTTTKWLQKAAARTTDGRVDNVINGAIYELANLRSIIEDERDMAVYHSINERMGLRARA